MTQPRKCKCACCGDTWYSERPLEEVIAEADDLFPDLDIKNPQEMAITCEPCFIKIMDNAGRIDFLKYVDKQKLN